MLDGFAAHTHGLRVLIEPRLRGLDDVFVFPAFDAALVGRCALILERACPARLRQVNPHFLAVFIGGEVVRQLLAGRTAIGIVLGQINKIRFPKAACRLGARSMRLGQRERDPGLFACQDFLTFKVARSATTSKLSLRSAAFASCAIVASCDLSVPMLVTSCATIRWFVMSTALCTL